MPQASGAFPARKDAEWDEGRLGVELYHRNTDPNEYRNPAEDPGHQRTLEEMKRLLTARMNVARGKLSAEGER